MSVMFTSEAEKKRWMENVPTLIQWEFYSGDSLVKAVHKAKDLGWKDKKVQVRYEEDSDGIATYYVEPFEKDCGCKGMLKYRDYFD